MKTTEIPRYSLEYCQSFTITEKEHEKLRKKMWKLEKKWKNDAIKAAVKLMKSNDVRISK